MCDFRARFLVDLTGVRTVEECWRFSFRGVCFCAASSLRCHLGFTVQLTFDVANPPRSSSCSTISLCPETRLLRFGVLTMFVLFVVNVLMFVFVKLFLIVFCG